MSKPFIDKLTKANIDGTLRDIINSSRSITDIVVSMGYSKKGSHVSIVRAFLESNNLEYLNTFNNNATSHIISKECPVCSKVFKVSTNNTKELNKVTCSYSCSNTYFRSKENNPNWKGGGNYRERALKEYGCICQMCGFDNPLAIVVHHIDMDRSNNEISNLIVLCANCHLIAHNGNYSEK